MPSQPLTAMKFGRIFGFAFLKASTKALLAEEGCAVE